MDWQLPIVLLLVAAASCYLARQTWQSWSGKKGCKSGCGCGSKPAASGEKVLIPADQLTVRVRGRGPERFS